MTAIKKYSDTQMASVEYFSDSVIDEFIASRHGAPATAKTYRNSVNQLLRYFATNSITEPTAADVDAFINSLRAAKKADSTLRLYSAVCKLFFSFTAKRGIYPDIAADAAPLKLRKATTHKKQALTNDDAQALLRAVKGDDLITRRNRAIIALALSTGVRTVEISRANCRDFYSDADGWFLNVQGKGRTQADAVVRVPEQVAELINSYLEMREDTAADEPLFSSTSRNIRWAKNTYGKRLSEQSVQKIIKAAMIAAKIRHKDADKDKKFKRVITPHSCRHYAATTAIQSGVDVREISAMLRHSSLNVTAIYLNDLSVKTRRAELRVAAALFVAA